MLQHKIVHEIVGNPRFLGESPVMTSHSRKYVIISHPKSPKTRMREISQEEEGVMAAIASLKALKTQILKKLHNQSGRNLKYEQF